MKSEEIAVLRILYKHYAPIKLSALVEGFPDHSKSLIFDAVSRLQLLSFLSVTDCSSVLYVSINRHMRRTVLDLIEHNNANRTMENEIQISRYIQAKHPKLPTESSNKPDLGIHDNKDLWLRLPKRAIKLSASMLVFSFVILGTISALNSQSTTSSSTYESTSYMFVSSLPLATEIHKGKTVPVEHLYNSGQNKAYSTEPAIYEGILAKLISDPSSFDDPPLYYHYLISAGQGLLLLEPFIPVSVVSDLNSSLSNMSDNHGKAISST